MTYITSETGAVTVDWVVLTAGLVGLGLATMSVVSTGVQDTSDDIQDQLQDNTIIQSSFGGFPDLLALYTAALAPLELQGSAQAFVDDSMAKLQADDATLAAHSADEASWADEAVAIADEIDRQLADTGSVDVALLKSNVGTIGDAYYANAIDALAAGPNLDGDWQGIADFHRAQNSAHAGTVQVFDHELQRRGLLPQG